MTTWKKKHFTARQDIDDSIIWRMRFTCWITKTTNTHSERVIIIAYPRKQRLRQRASMLRYTHITFLVDIPRNMTEVRGVPLLFLVAACASNKGPLTEHDVMQSRGKWT